nr:sufB protein [Coccidia sp. AB-2023a]
MKLGEIANQVYSYGFKTTVEVEQIIGGLNKNTIKNISLKQQEPKFIKDFRHKALSKLQELRQPDWSFFEVPEINYDEISYYSTPKNLYDVETKQKLESAFLKLGLPIQDQQQVTNSAMDIIFDSVSISNQMGPFLEKTGIIFLPLFKAIEQFPYLVQRYLGTIVSIEDNFFSALNTAIFSEGSFCYIPKDTQCSFDLSTYFRTNSENFAQFERTLLIAEENSSVTYLEGCTAPLFTESQLHVAIVEILVKDFANVKYSTVQNWYRGNQIGEGGLYNFTTKRGICMKNASLEWTQVEMGSAITWKYPSTILLGTNSFSEFYSISYVSGMQIADTGSKMIHIGKNTKSRIISKSVSLNNSVNVYRGLVEIGNNAENSYNYTECDSLLIGSNSLVSTLPYTIVNNNTSTVQQEATISKISENYLFLLRQRGISLKSAVALLIYGFCSGVCDKLPIEFGAEIPLLISMRTEESIG